MSKSEYEPRTGSKVATAFEALLDGPMTIVQLAKEMNVDAKAVSAMLALPLKRHALVKLKNRQELLHYALPGKHDERFTLAETVNTTPEQEQNGKPSVAALAFANPFSKHTSLDFEQKPVEHMTEPKKAPAAKKTGGAPVPAPVDPDQFSAGFFSTGEMVISAGLQSIRLSTTATRQLVAYIHTFKETA